MIRPALFALPVLFVAVAAFAQTGPAVSGTAPDAAAGPPTRLAALSGIAVDTTALATVAAPPAALSDGPTAPTVPAPKKPLIVQAHAEIMRPAPLPDPDMEAPGPDAQQLASQDEASLHPSFYSNSQHFAGDGFAPGSTLENDQNNRRKPGGGMSLSIPMQ